MNWNRIFKILIPTVLFLWGSYCMLKSYGYCNEYFEDFEVKVPVEEEYLYQFQETNFCIAKRFNYQTKVAPNKTKEWQEQYDFHMFHAKRTYEDAKERVWWLPNISWRQRGREAWVAAFSTVGSQTVQLKLVVAVSSLLCQYGLDCLDEWEYIEDKLHWSKFHLEQCEIYSQKIHG